MKHKNQSGNSCGPADVKKQFSGVKNNASGRINKGGNISNDRGPKICMQGTEKVRRDTVLSLCSQVISQFNENTTTKKKNDTNKKRPFVKKVPSNDDAIPKKKKKKGPAMNYKELKELRKTQAAEEAAIKAAADADREKVLAKQGPQEVTDKMIKAAREKEAHRQGILHLWGRPGSGAFKAKRKRGGKH